MKPRLSLLLALFGTSVAVNNGLGMTPQMGWNSWNKFGCGVTEKVIRDTVDRMVELGLKQVGYEYVNVDDCWAASRDNTTKVIQSDPNTFPGGMKALADYAHERGMKFGLYSDGGVKTCASRPGSKGYEMIDAETYAKWGVDYLKYDNCWMQDADPSQTYPVMAKALLAQKRPIFFSLCEWGQANPAAWAAKLGNSWRTTGDIGDSWQSMMENILISNWDYAAAGPGGWNDPDMLEVGNGGMSTDEYKIHFSLWCIAKAPLLIGCDLQNISPDTLSILTNVEAIAVNQDALGKQGNLVVQNSQYHVWTGQLAKNQWALVVYNIVDGTEKIELDFNKLFGENSMSVRDLWAKNDLGIFNKTYTTIGLNKHQGMFLRLKPHKWN